jgi:hypothetical protein
MDRKLKRPYFANSKETGRGMVTLNSKTLIVASVLTITTSSQVINSPSMLALAFSHILSSVLARREDADALQIYNRKTVLLDSVCMMGG